jgi:hypothetical protein
MFIDEFTSRLNATNLLDATNPSKNSLAPAKTAFEAAKKVGAYAKLFDCWA